MNNRSTTIPIRFVSGLLDCLGLHLDRGLAQVARAGIAPALLTEENGRVTVQQFGAFYRLLAAEIDDETPALFSRPLRGGTLKFLCLGLLNASNLRVALHRFGGFFRIILDDLRFETSERNGVLRIALVEYRDLGPQRVLKLELMLMLVQGVASWLIERRIEFSSIELAYPKPAHAAEYGHMYAGPTRFDQAVTALHIERHYLTTPIRQDKAALSTFLSNAPTDWIYVSINARPTTHRVRDYLEAHLDRALTVDQVARALHTSSRTLARRLAAEGSNFQAVKDTLRRDVAIARLARSREPVSVIGEALGFEDPTAFNRAFKHWTGNTPSAYRRPGSPN
ncbi:MAG: AraC family transcriptional regulator [Azoarcus sp.]|jgi:AraC-like DNA-binding protein|nr:AraC family transcriptional regulator [Azoarcus sp.]MDD2875033.1 AraC family transcriptional regulator [Azoarcus sp.]MDX9837954.1 AraC family transcriptional regulator [Azoarcus sp.]